MSLIRMLSGVSAPVAAPAGDYGDEYSDADSNYNDIQNRTAVGFSTGAGGWVYQCIEYAKWPNPWDSGLQYPPVYYRNGHVNAGSSAGAGFFVALCPFDLGAQHFIEVNIFTENVGSGVGYVVAANPGAATLDAVVAERNSATATRLRTYINGGIELTDASVTHGPPGAPHTLRMEFRSLSDVRVFVGGTRFDVDLGASVITPGQRAGFYSTTNRIYMAIDMLCGPL